MTKKTWIAALTFALAWTIGMIIYNAIIKGVLTPGVFVSNLTGGIVGGLLFAWITQYTAKRLFKRTIVETADENVIKEGSANHFKGKDGIGGKLVLTDKRLIFKAHKFNIKNHQDSFHLGQVERLQSTKTFKFLENGLTLELTNNEKHKFIVDEPTDWIEKIMSQKQLSN